MNGPSHQIRRRAHRARPAGATLILLALLLFVSAAPVKAYWSAVGSGAGGAVTGTLAAPVDLTAPAVADAHVGLSWAAGSGGVTPDGYYITRHDAVDAPSAACASGPSTLLAGLSCTDTAVPDGNYTYVVTAVHRSWTATSTPSGVVRVTNDTSLGAAGSYSVLAATAVVSTGDTNVSGDLGVSPGTTVTGFPPGTVNGDIHQNDAPAVQAQVDLARAYAALAARPASGVAAQLGGQVLGPGTYYTAGALAVTGTLTLDADGDPNALFVIRTGAALNTAASSAVVLVDGASADNVFWVVAGAAGTGASSSLSGTILCKAAITLGAGNVLVGRALSRDAVTLAATTIRFNAAAPPTITIAGDATRTTKDVTPGIDGTTSAPPSSRVTVTVGGQVLSTTVSGTGTWSVTASTLSAGAYDVVAKVRGPSGDGATANQVLTVEVNPSVVALGSAGTYSVLATTAVVNTGTTHLSGDLGVSPSRIITGFGPDEGTLDGATHAGDDAAAAASVDLRTALDAASSRTPHTEIAGDLGGRTFHAGVHHITAALALTGTVTLDAERNTDGVFIFQTDAAFNTSASSTVVLTNGAQAAHVFWVVTGAAGTGANTIMAGTILARGAVSLGDGTVLVGRALSLGTITLAGNTLTGVTPAEPAKGSSELSDDLSTESPEEPSGTASS